MLIEKKAVGFLIGTFAMLIVGLGVIVAGFRLQFAQNTIDSAGRCRTVDEKIQLARALPEPKIVFIGGSSVHWGINAESIGNALGRDGMNFGTFAALGPEVILWTARQVLKPGDVAVLAFEYNMYSERKLTSDAISFVLGCGQDFLAAMSPLEFTRTALASDPFRPFHVLQWKLKNEDGASPNDASPARSRHGDPVGSAFSGQGSSEMKERLSLYRPLSIRVDEHGMLGDAIRDFGIWAAKNNIKVVATWPNTIWFDSYRNDPAFDKIRQLYARYDIPVVGEPQQAMYSADLFYDTQYHLSDIGIEKRTRDLLPILKDSLKSVEPPRHAERR